MKSASYFSFLSAAELPDNDPDPTLAVAYAVQFRAPTAGDRWQMDDASVVNRAAAASRARQLFADLVCSHRFVKVRICADGIEIARVNRDGAVCWRP
jgi:hypothetical protein